MTAEDEVLLLKSHRANVQSARDFAEFQQVQLDFLDALIDEKQAELDHLRTLTKIIPILPERT